MLSFEVIAEGAKASIRVGEECWEARYPSLMEAIAQAFIHNLLDSDEACEAAAVENHMIPWVKPIRISVVELHAMGFALQDRSRQAA